MRVLFLTRYGRLGASSRVRALQFIPEFEGLGWRCDVSPLFSDAYVHALYDRKGRGGLVTLGFIRRLWSLLSVGRYDLLWIEKELFPFVPALPERALRWFGIASVVDYDDAVYHRYDGHSSKAIRAVLGRKIDSVMRCATVVAVGNQYLASRAVQAGARRIEIVPTVVDSARYEVRERSAGPVTVGWIGSPSTAGYLRVIESALARVQRRCGARVRLIGSGAIELAGVDVDIVQWTEEREIDLIASCDIGIMPLLDSAWERGKCGYKLVQFMACGRPVVASPVGVNGEIVRHGENGFLATDDAQWEEFLLLLIGSAALRKSMGQAGRALVESVYSVRAQVPRLVRIFLEAAGRGPQAAS